jgi:hypothetical protein
MMLGYAPARSARIQLRFSGVALDSPPQAADLISDYGTYRRSVSQSGDSGWVLETESTLRLGVVEAAEYPKFAEFVAEVEAAERAILSLR